MYCVRTYLCNSLFFLEIMSIDFVFIRLINWNIVF